MARKPKPRYAPGSRTGKGGRPRRTQDPADHALHAQCTAAEYAAALAAAERDGVSLAEFVRRAAGQKAGRKPSDSEPVAETQNSPQ